MTSRPEPEATIWALSQPSARRSLMLCALGALLGLAIAGLGLFTAKGTRTFAVPAEDVALVNQVPILMSDYETQLRALYDVSLSQATAKQKQQVLDDMIREELYVQRGVELGMQSDTIEVRAALVGAVEAQAAADATMAQPDEAQLHAWYQAHLAAFANEGTMALDDYLLPSGDTDKAQTVVTELREDSATPAAIARLGLRRTSRMADGDEFYFAARIHLGDRLFGAIRGLKSGAVSDPIALPDGIHIIVMRHNEAPSPQRFASVRDRVLRDYVVAQARLLTGGNERFLRKRADIVIQKGFQ